MENKCGKSKKYVLLSAESYKMMHPVSKALWPSFVRVDLPTL